MPTNAELEAYLARQGLVYRLPELVRQALHEQGSPYRLEKVIEHFCKARNIPGEISRHVLTGLAEHPLSSSINLKQLLALDAYFAQGGRGFDQIPILRRVSLVDALRAEVAAAILIAAKPTQPNQTHYTRWDSRALARVRRHLLAAGDVEDADDENGSRTKALDVVLGPERAGRRYAQEEWHRLIEKDQVTLISIGSPRASLASEFMLARMMGLQPHGREKPPLFDPRLPFQFVWPDDPAAFPVDSTFALGPDGVRKADASLAGRIRKGLAAAVACEGALHVAPAFRPRPWSSYGIVAAQRRPKGHLWVVLAGLSGPATLAAARLLPEFKPAPDHPRASNTPSPIHWALVTAKISEGPGSPGEGDNRILHGWSLGHPVRHPGPPAVP